MVGLRHMLVGIHQIAVEPGRDVGGIARKLLRFQLVDSRPQVLVVSHQRLVTSRVHVVAMMVSPISPIIEGTVQEPPPEKTIVRIAINNHRPPGIGRENRTRPKRSGGIRRIVGNIASTAI